MSSTFLPFLYHTRTLQRVCRVPAAAFIRRVHRDTKTDNSIPFEIDNPEEYEIEAHDQSSTITPSEAKIFQGIFEDIAQGKLPPGKKHRPTDKSDSQEKLEALKLAASLNQSSASGSGSVVDQVRLSEVRDEFLQRYPRSLRDAAEMALGKFELEPHLPMLRDLPDLDEAEREKMAEWSRYEGMRREAKERVEALMGKCQTDIELWVVMEREVFSLPEKLGIVMDMTADNKKTTSAKKKKGTKAKKAASKGSEEDIDSPPELDSTTEATSVGDAKRSMDVYGPLYSYFLTMGLALLDSSFNRPSPLAFQILPRIKELGLSSYVLGVSTPFFAKLAQIYWDRFGDAKSALDMIQELSSLGLYADENVTELLSRIREELHGCTWGAQGPFVMAMMETRPFDVNLQNRLECLEDFASLSLKQYHYLKTGKS